MKQKIVDQNDDRRRIYIIYLRENLKGERTPDVSLAAHPKVLTGCCSSGDFPAAAILERESRGFTEISA